MIIIVTDMTSARISSQKSLFDLDFEYPRKYYCHFSSSARTYRSKSVSLDESLKPLANGLLSIFNLVICKKRIIPLGMIVFLKSFK